MEIIEITVSAGLTFNHPYESFSNFRPSITLRATLAPDEPEKEASINLLHIAEKRIEDHKVEILAVLKAKHEHRQREYEEKYTREINNFGELPF